MAAEDSKPIPTNIATEKWLIGACMHSNEEALYEIMKLKPDDFQAATWTPKIFRAIQSLVRENIPVDTMSLENKLTEMNQLKDIPGGGAQLRECFGAVVSTANYRYHVGLQIEFSQRWHLAKLANEIESRKKELFMRTFDSLTEQFQKIFSALSTKGDAYLDLENKARNAGRCIWKS